MRKNSNNKASVSGYHNAVIEEIDFPALVTKPIELLTYNNKLEAVQF